MLEKVDRFNEALSGWMQSIGLAAIVFVVVLTCVDVLGAKLFLLPVPGSLDMIVLAQLIAIPCAAAMTLIRDRHVSVELFVMLLPRRVQAVIDGVVQLLCLALFVIVVWRLFEHGYHLQSGGEQSPTAHIPLAPFAYTAAVAMVPVCLVLAQQFLRAILKVLRDES